MRTIRVTALAALLVAGLTACGAGGSGDDAKSAASAAPSTTASATASAGATGSAAPSAAASGAAGSASPTAGGGTAGGSGSNAPGTLPAPAGAAKDVLLAATGVMAKAGNAKLSVGTGAVAVGGGGSFFWAQPGGIDLVLTQPDGAQARLRAAGGSTWVGAPEQTAALVGGKPWMKVDPNAKAGASGTAVLAGVGGEDARGLAALAKVLDPSVALAAGAGSQSLAKVGVESVDGQEAVHFRATGVAEALLNGLTEDQKKRALEELGKSGGALDLWINGRNELVQLRAADLTPSRTGEMTVRYSELGRAPQVAAPPATDVFEVADLLKGFGG